MNISIRGIEQSTDRISALRAVDSFTRNFFDERPCGSYHCVIYSFGDDGFAIAVWKTKAGNITVQQCGWRDAKKEQD